jgi:hypothetical protein
MVIFHSYVSLPEGNFFCQVTDPLNLSCGDRASIGLRCSDHFEQEEMMVLW